MTKAIQHSGFAPGITNNSPAYLSPAGGIVTRGHKDKENVIGIRPAVWIKNKKGKMMKALNLKSLVILLLLLFVAVMPINAQSNKGNSITAVALYQAFRTNKAKQYTNKVMQISGIATYVGPDPYALPSVELAESRGKSSRVLCVLPFSDYLKLRHVSKGDQVIIQGEVRGFSSEHNYVFAKECKILVVNGKRP